MSILILAALSWTPIQASLASYSSTDLIAIEEQVDVRRGVMVSFEEIGSVTRDDIAAQLAEEKIPGIPEYGVTLYRVIYFTQNVDGAEIKASGAVAIPKSHNGPAPLLSYQHGTVSARHRVPSQEGLDLISMGLGGSGYVTALPDYIGLGESDTFHPYVHAKSLGTAVVDLLRATRQLCEELSISLNDQLFLAGYSEGGYATMAAHREIEHHYADEFTVTASAPMAGPYNLSEVMVEQILDDRSYPSPGYLPYTLISYERVYGLFGGLASVIKEPYAAQMAGSGRKQIGLILLEKLHPAAHRLAGLIRNRNQPLLAALSPNDQKRLVFLNRP